MKIFFDESGNSGQNLLDPNQPVFVIASHNFSEEETKKILSPIESTGEEIHFSRLKKYRKQQRQVIESLCDPFITSSRVKIVYYHKRFALVTHIVDQLIEKSFHQRGLDLYKKGLNISYSNTIYYLGKHQWDKELYERFLVNFQKMIRDTSKESTESFYRCAHLLSDSLDGYQKEILEPVLESELYIDSILGSIRKYSIDLTLPSITLLANWWYKETAESLEIIHDDSKQVEFWKNFIFYLSKMLGNEKVEVGYDYRKMTYPLSIDSVTMECSKSVIQIQLSDLIASSFAYCVKRINVDKVLDDEFANEILKSRLGEIDTHPVMPTNKITPEQLKTQDDRGINPLDYLAYKALENGDDFDKSYG
jgi:hypothetical protein